MSFYEDLSPYVYDHYIQKPGSREAVNVGWLDLAMPFSHGIVESDIVHKIGTLCARPVNRMRGYYGCPIHQECPVEEAYLGDGVLRPLGDAEIHVEGVEKTYCSPPLIYHYIVRHLYLPPKEFLDAVKLI